MLKNFLNKKIDKSQPKKYRAAYRCSLCNKIFYYGQEKEVPYDMLFELCTKVVRNQMFLGNPALYQAPMQLPHECGDGNCGMGYFAGFKHN